MKTHCTLFLMGIALLIQARSACAQIDNIYRFLEKCPADDPATAQILTDFKIRSDGVVVTQFPCTDPISSMSASNYTDPLIVLQGLRVIYYMDRGMSGHLPWTPGTLYDWMKSQIKGIHVRSDTGGSYCCETFSDGLYMVVAAQNDFNRDFDRTWPGISGNIGLYAHEARHVAGYGHSSCCGIPGGCDDTFDTNNLSAYAVQWWLNKDWLYGDINVGFSCADSSTTLDAANWHLGSCNSAYRDRFCTNQPPLLSMPANPGGSCPVRVAIRVSQILSNAQVCWSSVADKHYQVQYSPALNSNVWTTLGGTVLGSGLTNCVTDTLGTSQHRFYRVLVLP
jgi:hypothetical protein